jgi:hypothetical protein
MFFASAMLAVILGDNPGVVIGSFLTIGYTLLLLSVDASRVAKYGLRVPIWLGALLPALYLFKRAKATGRNNAAFVTWIVTYVVAVIIIMAGTSSTSIGLSSASYQAGQEAGSQAAQDRFNDLFGSIEDTCAAKADYFNWSDYKEFIRGCVEEYGRDGQN